MTISEISILRHEDLDGRDIDDHIDYKVSRNEDRIKWERTKSPLVRIGTFVSVKEANVVVELRGRIEGIVTLQSPESNIEGLAKSIVRKVPKLFVPHSSFRKSLQGLGYASAIYRSYLNRGASFVTQDQTAGASKLWDSLASKGYKMIYVEIVARGQGRIIPKDRENEKVLKCLLGKGAKPENLFYL